MINREDMVQFTPKSVRIKIGDDYIYNGKLVKVVDFILGTSKVYLNTGEIVDCKELSYQCRQTDMLLPTDAQERKQIPIVSGVLDYFPLAIAEVAKCSWAGNQQHHPDKPLHWNKEKSFDHADCIGRHLIDRGKFDTDGSRHSAKLAWRALALLEIELERENEKTGVR